MQALWVRTIRGIDYGHACSMIVCMDSGGKRKVGMTEQEGVGLGGTLVGFLSELLRLKCRMGHSR